MKPVRRVTGPVAVLDRADVDTDQIVPKQFLKRIDRTGFGEFLFFDWRLDSEGRPRPDFELNDPACAGAKILIAGANFGCGSSREHAPQAIQRWGIRAIVGESFSEIFFGNSVALGMPCLTVSAHDAEALLSAVEANPQAEIRVSVAAQSVEIGGARYSASVPAGAREAFTRGTWDATGLLLDDFDQVRRVAGNLPYVAGF